MGVFGQPSSLKIQASCQWFLKKRESHHEPLTLLPDPASMVTAGKTALSFLHRFSCKFPQ